MTISTCSPKPTNSRAKCLTFGLSAVAVCGFFASFWLPTYGGTVQLVCLFSLVYALFVASRFLFVSYTYSLFCNERGITYFLIEEKQGKRTSLVCQLPLSRIRAVKPLSDAREQTRERYYTYVATMGGGEYQMVVAEGEKGSVGIKIEASTDFLAAFQRALAEKDAPTTEPTAE